MIYEMKQVGVSHGNLLRCLSAVQCCVSADMPGSRAEPVAGSTTRPRESSSSVLGRAEMAWTAVHSLVTLHLGDTTH